MELKKFKFKQSLKKIKLKVKIYNYLTLNGNKELSEKIFRNCLKKIQKTTKKNSELVFKVALRNITTPISTVTKKQRKKQIVIPFFLRKEMRIYLAIKFIVTVSKINYNITHNLSKQILEVSNNKGSLKNKIKELNQKSFSNKNFAHYRWF